MKIYLVSEIIDLGSSAIAAYRDFEKADKHLKELNRIQSAFYDLKEIETRYRTQRYEIQELELT